MADPVADQERRAARKKAKKEKRAADGSRTGSGIYQLPASGFLSHQRQNKSGARTSAKSNFQRSLSLYGEGVGAHEQRILGRHDDRHTTASRAARSRGERTTATAASVRGLTRSTRRSSRDETYDVEVENVSTKPKDQRLSTTTGAQTAQAHSAQQLEIVPPTLAEVEQMDALRALETTALGSENRPVQSPQRVSLNGHFLNAEMNPHAGGGSRILAYGTKLFHGNVKNN